MLSGFGILTIALTRSSDGPTPSAGITCHFVCDLSEELTLIKLKFHTIFVQCREDLLEIVQMLLPSSVR